MKLIHGSVFLSDGKFSNADVVCTEKILNVTERAGCDIGTIQSENSADHELILDVTGKYVIPGLVDIHSHGAVNADASDGNADGLRKMSRYYAGKGVTSWCPTTMTLSEEQLLKAMHAIRDFSSDGANCVGVHLEGPFVSYEKRGAQNAAYLQKPNIEELKKLNDACNGQVRMITVAPEEDENNAFIREASKICTVSLGHSVADYEQARAAFEAGATHVTHMFNGMNGLHHRKPGIIGAAFDAGATVELICDGYHIHPSVIRTTFKMFGPERVILISDSMRATGMKNGTYELGGQEVTVKDRKAVLKDGTLAGSATNLFGCMCKAIEFGVPVDQAIFAATRNPARSIGIYDRTGSVHTGKEADLLLVTENFELKRVI